MFRLVLVPEVLEAKVVIDKADRTSMLVVIPLQSNSQFFLVLFLLGVGKLLGVAKLVSQYQRTFQYQSKLQLTK